MKHALLLAVAAFQIAAQEMPSTLPALAERNWFKAEPFFVNALPERAPAERAWVAGPAFRIDNVTAVSSGRAWQLNSKLRFSLESATYEPPHYRMIPTRDTAVAARFEFRF